MDRRIDDVPVTPTLRLGTRMADRVLVSYAHTTFHRLWPKDACPVESEPCAFCGGLVCRWGDILTVGHADDCPLAED